MQIQSSFQVYNASAGSGKTFTLVKEYLKILLQSDNQFVFQHILAITFTNKAASEMKDRVLKNLLEFSDGDQKNSMLQAVIHETNLDLESIRAKSKRLVHNILQNYSSFHINTIDSFTSKLIKSFAFDLGLTLDFEVTLDPQSILEESIDIIISKIGIDKELTAVLLEFAKQKTLEDKSWDISRELLEISTLLLKENDAQEIKKLSGKSISDFKILEKKILEVQRKIEKQFIEIGQKGLEIIENLTLDHKDFYYSDLPNFFKKLLRFKSLKSGDLKFVGRLSKSMSEGVFYGPKKPDHIKIMIDGVSEDLSLLYAESEKLFHEQHGSYQLNKLVLNSLIPLSILNSIAKVLEDIKIDNNIRLIGEFNQIISEHLRTQPAAFIYEKIGEKYKYYFIDEMQDTSVMQWQNMIPLIDNAISEENSGLLLVGDAKQAIYRWRGGRAEQFIQLSTNGSSKEYNPFQIHKSLENLDTNYRSYSEIVNFNNQFFTHISNYFQNDNYKNLYKVGNNQKFFEKEGGYVQLNFLDKCQNNEERDQIFPEKIVQIIQELDGDYDRNEICVLVRKKSQGIAIANYLSEKGIQIVSSETLMVKNNYKVDVIIQLLSYLKDDNDTGAKFNILYFLHDHLKIPKSKNDFIAELMPYTDNDFYKELQKFGVYFELREFGQMPYYESVEYLIRSFKLTKNSDAYLQFFMDFVFEFSIRRSKSNIDFLEYWNQKKDKLSVIASNNANAVQIMTIHKSKGLEFPVVIYPYDLDVYYLKDPKVWIQNLNESLYHGFDSFRINSSSSIEHIGEAGEKLFRTQQSESELDNFNLLYVALTRAMEHLYIVSEINNAKDKLKTFAHFFIDYLKKSNCWVDGKTTYDFGSRKRLSVKESNEELTEIQHELISTSWKDHQFNIVANSSTLWGSEREDAIKFGNMIHELLSGVFTEKDISNNVNKYVEQGLLGKDKKDEIEKVIREIVNHEALKLYYQSDKTIFTEREILTKDKQVLIPDRLVFDGDKKVTIIDYKTGKPEKSHHNQVEKYAMTLSQMGFEITKKILVYIDKKIIVIEV